MTECCELMTLALDRSFERRGLERAPFFSLNGGPTGTAVILHFKRGKKGDPFPGATYGQLSFCPFCGERLERKDADAKQRKASP